MAAQLSGPAEELRRDAAEELAAVRSLGGGLDAEQMAADAGYAAQELWQGVEPGFESPAESELAENRHYKRDNSGRFAETGAATHSHKGGRGSKGNPKNPTTQSNTSLKAAPGDNTQAQVDAAEKAHKKTAMHGGSVLGAATIGKSKLNVRAGSPGVKREEWKRGGGSRHQKAKHGSPPENTDDRDAAKAMVLGNAEKRGKGKALRLYKNIHAVTGKENKRKEMTNITAYKKK